MLPLFLPPQFTRLDRVLRAIAGLILFNAAYMAENVRGGLQAIPRGTEAGSALGLSARLLSLIVLPQALRAVIPALVGEFIGLFKDTSSFAVWLVGVDRNCSFNFGAASVLRSLCGGLFIHWFNLLGLLLRNVFS